MRFIQPERNVTPYGIAELLAMINAVKVTNIGCELWLAAAVAFRSLGWVDKGRLLTSQW